MLKSIISTLRKKGQQSLYKGLDKHHQSGRSMTEMLGVLAIIGILSVGSIVGYRFAMTKYLTNELIAQLNSRAVVLSTQMLTGKPLSLDEMEDYIKNYKVTYGLYPLDEAMFEIAVSDVPVQVCRELFASNYKTPTVIYANNQIYTGDDSICLGGETVPEMVFVYEADLVGREGLPCAGDYDCGKCETCENNQCKNPKGYIYYQGECVLGNPCNDQATWSEEEQKCVCPDGYLFVRGECKLSAYCPLEAVWNETIQECECTQEGMVYDALDQICKPNTCSDGLYLTYFWYKASGADKWQEKCCELGQAAAYYDENGQGSASGYCCPKGYVAHKDGSYSYCAPQFCPDSKEPVTYYLDGADIPICCPEGQSAASVGADQKLHREGICCPSGYVVYKGNQRSYCVPESCPNGTVFTTFKAHGYRDDVPICCPEGVVAAEVGESGGGAGGGAQGGGTCCQPGSEVVRTNATSRCSITSCPEGEHLLYYKSWYGDVAKCCPLDVSAAAIYDSNHRATADSWKNGLCCQPGETAVNSDAYGVCMKTQCDGTEHMVEYFFKGRWYEICCPANVDAAGSGWVYTGWGECCQPGEEMIRGDGYSACFPKTCPVGQKRFYFTKYGFYDPYPMAKCCDEASPGAAYCNSSGECSSDGYCCAPGEQVVANGNTASCVKAI